MTNLLNGAGTIGSSTWKKNKIGCMEDIIYKTKCQKDYRSKCKRQTLKLLEENIGSS